MSSISSELLQIQNNTELVNSSQEAKSELDPDAFLQLLMVQLQNQDPLNPMDSNEMMAQQATLTQVQETQELNNNLTEMTSYIVQVNELGQASSMIGKEVSVVDPNNDGEFITGTVTEANFYSDATTITVDGEEYSIYSVASIMGEA